MNDPAPSMRHLCEPRSIAIVGASEDLGKFGGRVMHQLVRHGYAGMLYPINPRRDTINGLAAFASVSAVPQPPDAAIIAVPPAVLADTVRDCVAGGVKVAIVITGNLSVDGDDGSALEHEVVSIARAGGMRLLGPNCLGVINPHAKLAFSPSVTMAVDRLPAGAVGIASQSGALMTAMFIRGHDLGIGFSACISVGNQADLELADAFEYLVDDPATGAICLYVEGLKDRDRFASTALRAREAGKPVIAVKAGRTRAGAEMANSHTGSLAGSYEGFEALCRRLGIVVTDSTEAAVPCADALARHGVLRSPGLAVLSSSGGAAVLASDAVAAHRGLEAAALAPATRDAIGAMTPQPLHAAMIDFGGFHRPFLLHEITRTLELLAADPAVGAMVYVMTPQPLMDEVGAAIAGLQERSGVPIAFVSTAGSVADGVHAALRGRGLPVYPSMDDALRVLAALVDYRRIATAAPAGGFPTVDTGSLDRCASDRAPGLLTEPQTKQLLRAAGLPVTRETLAASEADARDAAASLGFPVVLKGVARGLIHKSDAGAVALNLGDAAAVGAAFAGIRDAVNRAAPGAAFEGCLVQEMATGGVLEAFVGARHDPQHGPMVLVGVGGVFVEIFDDVVVLAAPVSPSQVLAELERLTAWPLFRGARGRPVADADALAEFVSRVSLAAAHLGARLEELDVNPVLVRGVGEGVLALDARAVWRG